MTDTPRGASKWEGRVFQLMQSHAATEEAVEAEYHELASSIDAADVRFLIELILADEKRHHLWLGQLSNSVKALIEMDPEPDIPWIRPLSNPSELLKTTKRFLAIEQDDAEELRHLLKELDGVKDSTLWALIVNLILLDTKKHIEILQFIRHRAKN
ncbi:MAG TPA: hypothetical protein VMU68_09080 [Acidimicrobiales bacterium]|nr:hypothetical protein [Acidimicrobiales bacterium]